MIYRRLDENGDYIFGRSNEFLEGSEAVGQAIKTRILLLLGEWWENVREGFPLWQSVLGSAGSEEHLRSIDNIIRDRINRTLGVESIESFDRDFDRETRVYSFKAVVNTEFSEQTSVSMTLNVGA